MKKYFERDRGSQPRTSNSGRQTRRVPWRMRGSSSSLGLEEELLDKGRN